jgi:NSS family neurotransmitter:Na+ symporter
VSQVPREHWGSRLGFVLAAVGSAVGLGNMWRFSYLTAENGGAAFVLLYIAITLVVGLPVLLAELTIGRGSGRSPIGALLHYGGRGWAPLGVIFVACGFLILAYYSVIAGWTLRYALDAVFLGFAGEPEARFGEIATGASAIGWHLLFMALTVAVVLGGVHGGIERVALALMPLLFLVVCGIAIYASTLEGAAAGYTYYLTADFGEIWSWKVFSDAASQAFFSLSLGMGAMLTYASYLSFDHHLPNESLLVALTDFAVAFVAGLAVFPLIFALGLQQAVGGSTVGALFITLPSAFAEMGTAGTFVGTIFFLALAVAALTSAISLLEVVVSAAIDGLGWGRRRAAVLGGAAIAVIGIGPALDLGVLDWMDKLAGNVLLVGGGLSLALFVGWFMKDPMGDVSRGAEGVRWFALWRWLLRIPVPCALAVVLYGTVAALFE